MLKRQGVKRAVRVAQIIKGVEGAVEYRAHQHPDIPDSEKPMTMLGNIAAALAKVVVFLRDLGLDIGHLFRGRRGKATFARVLLHQELRTLFPHIKGDFAFPTPPQGPMGREAYRLSRARIRNRFKHRVRYGKIPVALRPEGEYALNQMQKNVKLVMGAAIRAGVLTQAEAPAFAGIVMEGMAPCL